MSAVQASSNSPARVRLAHLTGHHAAGLLTLMQTNQAHLEPWNPPAPIGFYTLAYWQRHADIATTEMQNGSAQRWVIESPTDAQIIGTINLTQIARGPFHSAMLGYQIDHAHEGKGLMFEALTLAIAHAFEVLKLHRLQASFVTSNTRSEQLLQRLGFETIGIAKHYLFINGAWRDHVLTQRISAVFDESAFTHKV
jgi:[ribosomal protein S5]-alanine N-acetyltransferase